MHKLSDLWLLFQDLGLYATGYHPVKCPLLHEDVCAGLRIRDEVTWGSVSGICVVCLAERF